MQDFSAKCGADVPEELVALFSKATNPQAAFDCAVEQCVGLVQSLHREGVESFHLYTLNQSKLAYEISSQLLSDTPAVRSIEAA